MLVEGLGPCLTCDQHPGGHIPGKAGEHHAHVQVAGGQPGEINDLRAVHPNPQTARDEAVHQLSVDAVLHLRGRSDREVGKADDCLVQAALLDHVNGSAVKGCARSGARQVALPKQGQFDHPKGRYPAFNQREGDPAQRTPVREIDRAVDRIEDPERPAVGDAFSLLLAEEPDAWGRLLQGASDRLLDSNVDLCRIVAVALGDLRAAVPAALPQQGSTGVHRAIDRIEQTLVDRHAGTCADSRRRISQRRSSSAPQTMKGNGATKSSMCGSSAAVPSTDCSGGA